MSDSPNADGIFFSTCGLNFSEPIIMLLTADCLPPTTTISASSWSSAMLALAFFTPGTIYVFVLADPAMERVSMSRTGMPGMSVESGIFEEGGRWNVEGGMWNVE
jgi:hypothetical protein